MKPIESDQFYNLFDPIMKCYVGYGYTGKDADELVEAFSHHHGYKLNKIIGKAPDEYFNRKS